jgi:flagellar biosynthetic protein FliO
MDLLPQMGGVALVLALLGATLWWLRNRGVAQFAAVRNKAGKRMEVVERLSLVPQHSLHLVRLADRALVVAVSPSGCRLLESAEWKSVDAKTERRESAV